LNHIDRIGCGFSIKVKLACNVRLSTGRLQLTCGCSILIYRLTRMRRREGRRSTSTKPFAHIRLSIERQLHVSRIAFSQFSRKIGIRAGRRADTYSRLVCVNLGVEAGRVGYVLHQTIHSVRIAEAVTASNFSVRHPLFRAELHVARLIVDHVRETIRFVVRRVLQRKANSFDLDYFRSRRLESRSRILT
jgi:hypothetical protein